MKHFRTHFENFTAMIDLFANTKCEQLHNSGYAIRIVVLISKNHKRFVVAKICFDTAEIELPEVDL